LSQKWLRIQVSGGAKFAQGRPKYLQGGNLPPTPRAYGNREKCKIMMNGN